MKQGLLRGASFRPDNDRKRFKSKGSSFAHLPYYIVFIIQYRLAYSLYIRPRWYVDLGALCLGKYVASGLIYRL